MSTETGTPLAEPARTQARKNLQAVLTTARTTCDRLESDRDLTAGSLLADVMAMEAILRRVRQAVNHGR